MENGKYRIVNSYLPLTIYNLEYMNEEFRKTAPAPLAPVPFNISQPFETVLENGLKIVVFEDRRFPLVSFRLAFSVGNSNDSNDEIGLTSATISMLNEGTINYTSKALAEKIERLGAHLSASSGSDNIIVSGSTLSFYSAEILDLMAELVLTPTFPESELNLYKQNLIEIILFERTRGILLPHFSFPETDLFSFWYAVILSG